jgi:hypothetical protein
VDIGSYGRNSDGGIFAHSKLGKYLETHLGIPEDKQLPGTLCLAPHIIVGDEAFPLKSCLTRRKAKRTVRKATSIIGFPEPEEWWKMYFEC